MKRRRLWKSCLAGIVGLSLISGNYTVYVAAEEPESGGLEVYSEVRDPEAADLDEQPDEMEVIEGGEALEANAGEADLSQGEERKESPVFDDGTVVLSDGEEENTLFTDEDEVFASAQAIGAAQIGDAVYDTFETAWAEAIEMDEYNGAAVSEDNPVVITLLKDCELENQIRYLKGHVKLTSESTAKVIKRGAGNTGHLFMSGKGNISKYPPETESERSLTLENIVLDGGAEEGCTGGSLICMSGRDGKRERLILGQGAVLQNNSTRGSGGGISTDSQAVGAMVDILEGAAIRNNTADKSGGGIYVYGGSVNLKGGSVSGNGTTGNYTYGGGVCAYGGNFHMSGGEITGNSCAYNSGGNGIYLSSGTEVTLTGGTISGNTNGKKNVGIECSNNSLLKLGGAISITDDFSLYGAGSEIQLVSPVENSFYLDYFKLNTGDVLIRKADSYGSDPLDVGNFPFPLRIRR